MKELLSIISTLTSIVYSQKCSHSCSESTLLSISSDNLSVNKIGATAYLNITGDALTFGGINDTTNPQSIYSAVSTTITRLSSIDMNSNENNTISAAMSNQVPDPCSYGNLTKKANINFIKEYYWCLVEDPTNDIIIFDPSSTAGGLEQLSSRYDIKITVPNHFEGGYCPFIDELNFVAHNTVDMCHGTATNDCSETGGSRSNQALVNKKMNSSPTHHEGSRIPWITTVQDEHDNVDIAVIADINYWKWSVLLTICMFSGWSHKSILLIICIFSGWWPILLCILLVTDIDIFHQKHKPKKGVKPKKCIKPKKSIKPKKWIKRNRWKYLTGGNCKGFPIQINSKEFIDCTPPSNGTHFKKYNVEKDEWDEWIKYPEELKGTQEFNAAFDQKKQILYIYSKTANNVYLVKIDIAKSITIITDNVKRVGRTGCALIVNHQFHIVGGVTHSHLIWNEEEKQFDELYEFNYDQLRGSNLSYPAFIHIKSRDTLLLLGGASTIYSRKPLYFDLDTIHEFDVHQRRWKLLQQTLPVKLSSFGCILSSDEKQLIILGGVSGNVDYDPIYEDSIYVLNTQTMQFKKSNIKCPKPWDYYAIIMLNSAEMWELVAFALKSWTECSYEHELIKVIARYCAKEYIHLLHRDGNHTKIQLSQIIQNC